MAAVTGAHGWHVHGLPGLQHGRLQWQALVGCGGLKSNELGHGAKHDHGLRLVYLLMALQLAALIEGFLANITCVRFFTSVEALVLLEATFEGESLSTFTRVRLDATVDPLVCNKVASSSKSFPALLALVWLFSRVSSDMRVQPAALCEGLVAMRAGERLVPAMRSFMFFQSAVLREILPALLTLEGLLGHVQTHVGLQVSIAGECFAALLAGKRAVSRMTPRVDFQSIGAFK